MKSDAMRRIGEHAVVLGGGMAGLLAARALADAYERVTVVERDVAPPAGQARKGVPQGRHVHQLLPRGQRVLEELFPGLSEELIAGGAVVADPVLEYRLMPGGHLLRKAPIGGRAIQASRPFLESHVRERVRSHAGVRFVEGCDVVGLVATGAERVTGARITDRVRGGVEEELAADLVVDAMGRGGRTSVWLEALGVERATADEVHVSVAYASRYLRLPPDALSDKAVAVGPRPERPRGMALLAVEGDRHVLSLAGVHHRNRPPTSPEAFLAYAATVAPPDVFAAVQAAEPLGEIVAHRYPSDLRRRYERLRHFPAGLLVTGDALCSFDPIYAQGMTVAALEAAVLSRCLAAGAGDLPRRFFRAAAKTLDAPWLLAVTADLGLSETKGPRSTRLLNAYIDRLQATAERDTAVAEQFVRVIGLLDPPSRLVRPSIVARVARTGLRRVATPMTARVGGPADRRPAAQATGLAAANDVHPE
jgi:2-polyprenyl-6-methoxyphenol hydroxylase-like FAD-dependent oxidoreductase